MFDNTIVKLLPDLLVGNELTVTNAVALAYIETSLTKS